MNRIYIKLSVVCFGALIVTNALTAEQATKAARVAKQEIAETKPIIKISKAVAALNPTRGNKVSGIVHFTQVDGGVRIVADVEGLYPGKHGFHIHEYGDCSAPDAASAGGHFNPGHRRHGSPDSAERHAGDLGNLVADSHGNAHYERIDPVIQLDGPDSIVGRSIIVHANADDYTSQPSGNAGGRISCGVIEAQ
jgi:Cu-Zn family superoxide dismutase